MKYLSHISSFLAGQRLLLLMCLFSLFAIEGWGVTNGDAFTRISSIGDLSDGDEIIFVNQAETYACGTTQNENNRTPVSISVTDHTYTYSSSDNVQVFVVKINDSGKFGFHTGSGYIYSASSSKNYLRTNTTASSTAPSGASAWTLSIASYVVTAQNVSNTSYYIQFNGTDYFSQYTGKQTSPYIFKKPSGYSITLDKNGGSANGSAKVAADATTMTITSAPTKTGFSPEGYYTSSDCTTKIATAAGALQANIEVSEVTWTNSSSQWKKGGGATFYTNWTPKVCAITLDKGTDGTTDGSVNYTYGNASRTGDITHATKTGYHLNGYYTAASSGTKILNADGTIAGNSIVVSTTTYTDASGNWAYDGTSLTLYAQWTIDNYTIHWQANGEDWEGSTHGSPSLNANYNTQPATIPSTPTNCDGTKVFAGWSASEINGATNTEPVDLFATVGDAPIITGNVTFYAVFANRSGSGIASWNITTTLSVNKKYVMGAVKAAASSTLANNTDIGAITFSTDYSSTSWGQYTTVTPNTDGQIATASVTDAMKWRLVSISDGHYKFRKGANYLYLHAGTGANTCGVSTDGHVYLVNMNSTCKDAFYLHPTSESTNKLLLNTGNSYGYRMYASNQAESASMCPYVRFYEYSDGYTYTNYVTSCCSAPTALTNGSITSSSQTVSWTAPSSAPASGYLVAYSNTETSDPSDTILNAGTRGNYTVIAVAAGTLTTTIPCNAAGTFNWWVRSKCSASNGSDWEKGTAWTMNNIYLNTNYDWNAGNARFAVYYWNDDDTPETGWSKLMAQVSGCYEGIYTCVIPDGYNNVIFGRFSTSQTTDPTDWTNRWNQTSNLTIPTSPAKDYFTLSSKTGDNDYNGSWSVYAPSRTITFNNNADFSTTSAPSSQCIVDGAKVVSPTNPKAMGKEVDGWYTEAGCENEWNFSTQTVSANQTLYAHWTNVASKTIYLDCSADLSGSKKWDAESTVLFARAYIDGTSLATEVIMTSYLNSCDNHVYAFTIPGNATHVSFARCATGTTELPADWASNPPVYNAITGKPVVSGKDWYKVTDWGSADLDNDPFAATSYSISFAANSGDGLMDADAVVCDADYTIKTNAFTRGCYEFTGWKANVAVTINSSTVSAGTLIGAGSEIEGVTSNITLTAQWSQYSCTVTLDKNGATSGSNQTVSATCGSAMPLTTTADGNPAISAPTKTAHTLLGYWDTSASSGGTQYYSYDGSSFSSSTNWDKETNSAQTLYARWEAKVDHFIDDMHGTDGYTGDGHSESGAGYTMPNLDNVASGNECETKHYIFVGWVIASGQTSEGTISGSPKIWRPGETNNASNATYYAVWAEE